MSENIVNLRKIGKQFEGRVEPWKIEFALEYVDFNEVPLAFETLCSYIAESDGKITQDEYDKIIKISEDESLPIHPAVSESLKKQIETN